MAWLGSPPFDRVAVRDPGTADSPGQMRVESHVAKEIARAWFARLSGHDAWKDGAAEYLQSRITEQLFDRRYFLKAYRYDAVCWFGCHVPWSFRVLPLSRWTAVTDPVALAFATLERELGWPTLQGALRAVAAGGSDPVALMSLATGRDVRPLFDAALSGAEIDYSIASLKSTQATSCPAPCYRTNLAIRSEGPVPLPLTVRVTFADGQHVDVRFDGTTHGTDLFESATPAVAAHLDPDRVLLLDRNPLNNARVQPRQTNVPVTKWMARWIVWLQDAMLTRTFPV
jgi:hypothetical protein